MLDSQAPSIPVKAYAYNEIRYKMLSYTQPRRGAAACSGSHRRTWTSGGASTRSMADRWPALTKRGAGEPGSHVAAPAAAAVMDKKRSRPRLRLSA